MFAGDEQLRIGTSSWSSKDWVGPFYPQGLAPARFVEHYATVYDTVEIDATFYRMPTPTNIAAWVSRTPDNFLFAVKTPRLITHEKILLDADDDMSHFLEVTAGLGNRLGPILLQFPYFNRQVFQGPKQFFDRLDSFLAKLPSEYRFAVETRNKNWLGAEFSELCRKHNVALAWTEQAWMPKASQWWKMSQGPTADFAYIRWLGDHREIEKITKTWGETVVDRESALSDWVEVVGTLRSHQVAVFGYFNNHFAGHAPASVELFRQLYEKR